MPENGVIPASTGRPHCEIDYELLKRCGEQALPQAVAATFLKISLSTFKNRLKDDEAFKSAWEGGLSSAQQKLRMIQWKHALGKGQPAVTMAIHMSKHILGETDKSVIEHANKDGKPLTIATQPAQFMGVDLATAEPHVLEALEVIAEAQMKAAAEAARDITGEVTEA